MFTNEEKKQFQHCTVDDQLEIFKAFLEGRTHYYDPVSREWELATIINPTAIYRTIPPVSSEGATPIKGIPWEVIDRKWNWAAMDMDGSISLFVEKPYRAPVLWCCSEALENDDYHYINGYFKLDTEDVYWTTSLTKRPEYC